MVGVSPPALVASDLDGTLIPVPPSRDARAGEGFRAWRLRHPEIRLAYLTGRRLDLALAGILEHGLPRPDFLGCDVGTSLYRREGSSWSLDETYRERLRAGWPGPVELAVLEALDPLPGLTPQGAERNTEFKISFFTEPGDDPHRRRPEIRAALKAAGVDANLVASVDPVRGTGLVDVLPPDAGKLTALEHLGRDLEITASRVLFAGDSGNDRDVLLHGGPAILVGNAPEDLRRDVAEHARRRGLEQAVFLARAAGAEGVLEGLAHFGAA